LAAVSNKRAQAEPTQLRSPIQSWPQPETISECLEIFPTGITGPFVTLTAQG